ncbi:MAG: Flp pilus assembly protein CpaB [Pseudomonadota bacterium]
MQIGEIVKQKPLLVACVSALAACLFAAGYLGSREASIMSVAEPVGVAVAARDIAAGEAIDENAIGMARVPRRFVQPAAFSSVSDAAGRVAVVPIRAGAHMTPANARRVGDARGLAAVIPAGRRAVAIPLDDAAGSSGIIKPYDVVDVMATFDLGQESSVRRTTLTIVEDVQVLAVGSEIADALPAPKSAAAKGGMFGGQAMVPGRAQATATLAVTPAEAQALAFARESGALTVALRAWGDDAGAERTPPTTIATITGGHDELVPMKKGYREYKGR